MHPQPGGLGDPVADARAHPHDVVLAEHDAADVGVEQPEGAFGDGVQGLVDVARGQQLGDDLPHGLGLGVGVLDAAAGRPPGHGEGQPHAGLAEEPPGAGVDVEVRVPAERDGGAGWCDEPAAVGAPGGWSGRGQPGQPGSGAGEGAPAVVGPGGDGDGGADEQRRVGGDVAGGSRDVGGCRLQQGGEAGPARGPGGPELPGFGGCHVTPGPVRSRSAF